MVTISLFSSGPRPDNGPPPYAWSAYQVLDRSHFHSAAETRRELDDWFSRLPPTAAAQIAERFRDDNDTVHLGAFLELYVHELGLRMGAEVDIDVGNDEADNRRPDFLLRWDCLEVYVEATAIAGDDGVSAHEKHHTDQLYDAINAVTAPRFFVDVEVLKRGASTPPIRRLTAQVQGWLDQLDPDVVLFDTAREPDDPQETVIDVGEWAMRLQAFAIKDDGQHFEHHRVVGTRVDGGGSIDDITPLRRKFKKKAGHYGQFDKPYVLVALAAGTFVDDRDVEHALLGPIGYRYDLAQERLVAGRQRDGTWMRDRGPVNTRLSGLLTLVNLSPTAVCAVEPTFWANPWAERPLPHPGPWRRIEASPTGRTVEHDRTQTIAKLFDLPQRWPAVPREH